MASPENAIASVMTFLHISSNSATKRIMAVTKRTSEPDDLTVVVVQVTSVGAAAWEGVA